MTNDEAKSLISVLKEIRDPSIQFPPQNDMATYVAYTKDSSEAFEVRVNRKGKFELCRCSYLLNHQVRTVLVRIDLDKNKPHKNPDEDIIIGPHIHIYKEGMGDKWAYPLYDHVDGISDNSSLLEAFKAFCNYCHLSYVRLAPSIDCY